MDSRVEFIKRVVELCVNVYDDIEKTKKAFVDDIEHQFARYSIEDQNYILDVIEKILKIEILYIFIQYLYILQILKV